MSSIPIHPRCLKAGLLQIEVFADRVSLGSRAGQEAARYIIQLLASQDTVRIIFAAAPSQRELLRELTVHPGIDWSRVAVFHMDEYIGLEAGSEQRFSSFLMVNLFQHVQPGKVHLLNASGHTEVEAECERYAQLLAAEPIDVVCLGIGENGHLAFNDPPVADFADPLRVKRVELDQDCRRQQVNDGCFARLEEVPTHALTLTIPALMAGKRLFCCVPGQAKRSAVMRTLLDEIGAPCPATILRQHPNCTLYVDQDAFDDEQWQERYGLR